VDAPDFIVPPPGLIPAREPSDEPDRTVHPPPRVLPGFTPPPGIAPTLTAVPPSTLIPQRTPPVPEPVETPAARPPHGAWRLRGPGSLEVLLLRPVVLGRDPAPDAARPDAAPIPLQDPARSVSKTHALIEVVDDRVMVTDLHSTNGTRLLSTEGETRELEAGRPTDASSEATVLLGEFAVRLDRAPLDTV
jgi:FHA domain